MKLVFIIFKYKNDRTSVKEAISYTYLNKKTLLTNTIIPAKISIVCYVHEITDHLTQEFTVKQITAVSRLDAKELTKVIYLKIKTFIPSDKTIETQIKDFDTGDVIFLKGKFVACPEWYSVHITIFLNIYLCVCL